MIAKLQMVHSNVSEVSLNDLLSPIAFREPHNDAVQVGKTMNARIEQNFSDEKLR
jgi:hypothetical protein